MKSYPAIGIRPIVDSRRMGIRDALEGKVREMAEAAKKLIEEIIEESVKSDLWYQ